MGTFLDEKFFNAKPATVSPKLESVLTRACESLREKLGVNLHSCCVYGSAVRGNAIEGVSDINLLIVLNASSAAAHQAVAVALEKFPLVDPFVLARRGFERSVRAFAPKFASIRRNYRVLHGADPLAEVKFDAAIERFLCEQALRNIRLRLVYSFITRPQHKAYLRFVVRNTTAIFVPISEVLRLEGISIPTEYDARIALFEREFKFDGQVLRDLLGAKRAAQRLPEKDAMQWHERLFPVLDAVLSWLESRWPNN